MTAERAHDHIFRQSEQSYSRYKIAMQQQ